MPSFFVLSAQSPEACDNSDRGKWEVVTRGHLGLVDDSRLPDVH